MPYGISPTLFYGGLVFSGGFILGYYMDTKITQFLSNTWMIALFTGFGAVGVYVVFQNQLMNSLPSAF